MAIPHVQPSPSSLPFDAEQFGWENFETFCAAWLAAGITLPNFHLEKGVPSRLQVMDAMKYGTAGGKQHGADILVSMENQATWVVQCKHVANFSEGAARKAIARAEEGAGALHHPAHYMLWVSGKVAAGAQSLVQELPHWSLWSGERLSQEFFAHTPRPQALDLVTRCFGKAWAKVFFPLPDSLLITKEEFFSPWMGEERLFHHHAPFVGHESLLDRAARFAVGGKGRKALILSAAGGIGKTRLLLALAEELGKRDPRRLVRFVNPRRSADAEPPRAEDFGCLTVFHDDAHRLDLPRLLAGLLSEGSRLILATRPGAEDTLREKLMDSGYQAEDIEVKEVGRLERPEMVQLANHLLGTGDSEEADKLARLSQGCSLVTVVGAGLLKRGDLTHMDLAGNALFGDEVFRRFEGEELERLRGGLEKSLMVNLLRAIALLSPWKGDSQGAKKSMADFLGVERGSVEAACDSLLTGGLVVKTEAGWRITPDLLSDHLVYSACYQNDGHLSPFFEPFRSHFQTEHSQTILCNLAAAEWRALQRHGSTAHGITQPFWEPFLQQFKKGSFDERGDLLERWTPLAALLPSLTLELANKTLELDSPGKKTGYPPFDAHENALERVPGLVKPLATWCDKYRLQALHLLWRLECDFPVREVSRHPRSRYGVFAEIAAFNHNFPAAPLGVLDWLEELVEGPEGDRVVTQACELLDTVLRPYFVELIERTVMTDRRTMTSTWIPLSVAKTRKVRDRALAFISEKIIPRGTVAVMNVLPVLAEAFRQTNAAHFLSQDMDSHWYAERLKALKVMAQVAVKYDNPLVHFGLRKHLRRHLGPGKIPELDEPCQLLVESLPDTFELRLARLTLSSGLDDSRLPYEAGREQEMIRQSWENWQALLSRVTGELLSRHPDPAALHRWLCQWFLECERHRQSWRVGELFGEIARQNSTFALALLEDLLKSPDTNLAGNAANLVDTSGSLAPSLVDSMALRGLASGAPAIVGSFLNSIRFNHQLQSPVILDGVLQLAATAHGNPFLHLCGMIRDPDKAAWKTSLIHALLERPFSEEEKRRFIEAVREHFRFTGEPMDARLAARLLDDLLEVPLLQESYDRSGFLGEVARTHPRLMYDFLVQRIERGEAQAKSGPDGYQAMPYFIHLRLDRLAHEPDFESLARGLFQRHQNSQPQTQFMWAQMIALAVAHTSPLFETLLNEHLMSVQSAAELEALVSLTRFDGSLLVFRCPKLTEAILKKAEKLGVEVFEATTWALIHGTGPFTRSYTDGEPDDSHRYLREEAEKAANLHAANRLLGTFYQTIVENEITRADFHRQRREERMENEW